MLPSRPRLQGWNPDSLLPAASVLEAAGGEIYRAIRNLDDGCDRMPEARAWSGRAHDAATAMFRRATDKASNFKNYTEQVANPLASGSASIGSARSALLNRANDVDGGELHVSDMWVVMIKPARVSAEKAAALRAQAESEQKEINRLLAQVGFADSGTAQKVQAAANGFGFALPSPGDPRSLDPTSGVLPPGDEVPNPLSIEGLMQQGVLRDHEMATTIRESREWTTTDGQTRRTVFMMDGSKHEIWEWGDIVPSIEDEYYDKNGNLVSATLSQDRTHVDGTQFTSVTLAGGTEITMTRTPDGKCTGGVTTADGRHGVLPDEFFSHPALTLVGGAMTGLEEQTKRGIPMLTAQSVDGIGKAAKYGGPTLGIATALYDTVTAKTFHDGCVAAISGAAGVGGGHVTGGLAAALITGLDNPELAPVFAAGGDVVGGWTFGYIGGIVGNIVCPG